MPDVCVESQRQRVFLSELDFLKLAQDMLP